jgi:hypothetical protein
VGRRKIHLTTIDIALSISLRPIDERSDAAPTRFSPSSIMVKSYATNGRIGCWAYHRRSRTLFVWLLRDRFKRALSGECENHDAVFIDGRSGLCLLCRLALRCGNDTCSL